MTAAQDTTVDDARVAADSAEGYAVYGNNTGNIKDLKDVAESDPVGNTITVNTTKTLGPVNGGYSAVDLHYSYMHIMRIHGYALVEIEKML